MKAVRRSRGKFTTLNAFARRSEVEVGGDGADSGKETSYSTYYMDVLWNLQGKLQLDRAKNVGY